MAATPPHVLLIDCPPSRNDDGGGAGGRLRRVWSNAAACKKACSVVALVLFGAAVVTGYVLLFVLSTRPLPSVYSVAITGVTGLDPAARDVVVDPSTTSPPPADDDDDYYSSRRAPRTTLSPVFNLTFQIDNTRDAYHDACVPGLSRADVSYGDAFLAGGSVPPFCAGKNRTSGGVVARAWGENVTVPQFLRDQLAAELAAGDASVDVKVTMPTYCVKGCCGGAVLSCKPKIGGGPSPACRLDFL